MTLLNAFVTPRAVHILTDAAGYHLDGTLSSVAQKVSILGHLPGALAARGPVFVAPHLTTILSAFSTFDDVLPEFTGTVWDVLELTKPLFDSAPSLAHLEFLLAGWSQERDRPECYVLATHGGAGLPSGELVPAHAGWLSPADPQLIERLHCIGVDVEAPSFDPVHDGLQVAQEQRVRKWDIAQTGKPIHCVGGFLQLTSVDRESVSTRILHRWPEDQMGELIDASPQMATAVGG